MILTMIGISSLCILCVAGILSILKIHEKRQRAVVREYQRKLAMNGLTFDDLWKQGGKAIIPPIPNKLNVKRIEDKAFKSLRVLPNSEKVKCIEDKNFRGLEPIINES